MNIHIGNLSHDTTEDDLREVFEAFGQVTSVNIIKDKYSGESRGFGFVEMSSKDEAQAALDGLSGKELKEKTIIVSEARPRPDNRGGSRGGGGGRGGGSRGWSGGGGGRGGGRRPW